MEDLRLAMGLMMVLSLATFLCVRRLCEDLRPRVLDGLAAMTVILVGVYIRLVWGQLWIVEWIPLPSVIILSNWFPLFLGALAAILWQRMKKDSALRRMPIQLVLIGATVWSEVYVIPRNPPECGNEWIEPTPGIPVRICRQTTPRTCSAAAAATILTAMGLEATEKEMAKLCLTGEGTTWLGLYHGLAIRLQGTGFRVEFFEGGLEELDSATPELPILMCCRLTASVAERHPDYEENRGWIAGVAHSAVLFLRNGDLYLIGDPSQKDPELWTRDDIENLWTGQGLRIVPIAGG